MDTVAIKKLKIIFIKEELKKFREIKRKCKNEYKNWFKSSPSNGPIMGYTSPSSLWNSPKFKELDDHHYFSIYGRFYITCLHNIYNDLRHTDRKVPHIVKVERKVYKDSESVINLWIEERIKFNIGIS